MNIRGIFQRTWISLTKPLNGIENEKKKMEFSRFETSKMNGRGKNARRFLKCNKGVTRYSKGNISLSENLIFSTVFKGFNLMFISCYVDPADN